MKSDRGFNTIWLIMNKKNTRPRQIIPEQNKQVFRIGCIIWQTHQAKLMADSYQQ